MLRQGTLWSTLLLRTLPVVTRWNALLDRISSPLQMRGGERKPTVGIAPKKLPLALETHGALFDRSDRFLVECATLAFRECARSGASVSLLCTWFRPRVSISLQWSLSHAIHARTLRLEQFMTFLPPPPPRAPLSFAELPIVASFVWYDRLTYM